VIVAKNGNNVEATGDKIASCFDNVASTLLLVWTGLKDVTGSPNVSVNDSAERT